MIAWTRGPMLRPSSKLSSVATVMVVPRSPVESHSVLEDDVQSMADARDVPQYGQENVDPEVSSATTLKEDTKRWEEDGKNDLEDVAASERHCERLIVMCWLKVEGWWMF